MSRNPVRLWCLIGLVLATTDACSTLLPTPTQTPLQHTLDGAETPTKFSASVTSAGNPLPPESPTLLVNPSRAAAGFDSKRMIYQRSTHQLEYFAHHEWIDTPTRMLTPLIVSALEHTRSFHAVISGPSSVSSDLALDTEVIRLQQYFDIHPSNVRFTLHAYIVNETTHRVVKSRLFDVVVDSPTENPDGGVIAANQAVQMVIGQLANFCSESAKER